MHSFPTRREVDNANSARLAQLPGPSQRYLAIDRPGTNDKGSFIPLTKARELLDRLVAPKDLTLKVMCAIS